MWTTHQEVGAEIKCPIFSPGPLLQSSPPSPSHACPALLLTQPWCPSFPRSFVALPNRLGWPWGMAGLEVQVRTVLWHCELCRGSDNSQSVLILLLTLQHSLSDCDWCCCAFSSLLLFDVGCQGCSSSSFGCSSVWWVTCFPEMSSQQCPWA